MPAGTSAMSDLVKPFFPSDTPPFKMGTSKKNPGEAKGDAGAVLKGKFCKPSIISYS